MIELRTTKNNDRASDDYQARQQSRITTACILAAGTGSRLLPLTESMPKCMTEVHGRSILERLIASLREQGFKRLVFVVGHLEYNIRGFLDLHAADFTIDYISNPAFATTNNIYSLWLAREKLNEPFVLIESDLIFDTPLLSALSYPDRIAVSRMLPWMSGTTVTLEGDRVSAFLLGESSKAGDEEYKTVNICSVSTSSWSVIVVRLEHYISAGRVTEYYEAVFRDLVSEGILDFQCVFFDENRWYEIDTVADLRGAHEAFARIGSLDTPTLPYLDVHREDRRDPPPRTSVL